MMTAARTFLRTIVPYFTGLTIIGLSVNPARAQASDGITIAAGGVGQVEVGGPFAGVEFHEGRPLPSRISFYYPVANSIDVSTDYWARGNSRPMALAIQRGDEPWAPLGPGPWASVLSPQRVEFNRREQNLTYRIAYDFCMTSPAFVFRLTVTNRGHLPVPLHLYTHLLFAVRTCHSFIRIDSCATTFDRSTSTVAATFPYRAVDSASFFVMNRGELPADWGTDASFLGISDSGTSARKDSLGMSLVGIDHRAPGVAAYIYQRTLAPGDSCTIVQVIGSCRTNELQRTVAMLTHHWDSDVAEYNRFVTAKALTEVTFTSGDDDIDKTAAWSRGILASNAHFLHGAILPMPCPAEYNFFFTHDVLMTDLGAVQFDTERVRRDLRTIAGHARDHIIPHAMYWRDDGFKTEYCTPDSWNHHWFILLAASYLRHSLDDSTCSALLPLLTKSVNEILSREGTDSLMHGSRPDWWDIGNVDGARAYLTILTIRALREYVFVRTFLHVDTEELAGLERRADAMQRALNRRLWDSSRGYLMNTIGDSLDEHYYMGSLLAVPFGELEGNRADTLLATANAELFDRRIGLRAVSPVDFATPGAIAYYKFAGHEAGEPYYYLNGGIWFHSNAWYVLAQLYNGNRDAALSALRATMTLDGIVHSPRGMPAMYEYRYAGASSLHYGEIDKPSFLWAAGYYLYTIYQLYGVRENVWNLSFQPPDEEGGEVSYTYAMGENKQVRFAGRGNTVALAMNNEVLPTVVVPLSASSAREVVVERSTSRTFSLRSINAILHSTRWDPKSKILEVRVSSFPDHRTEAEFSSPVSFHDIMVDGKAPPHVTDTIRRGEHTVIIRFDGSDDIQTIRMRL